MCESSMMPTFTWLGWSGLFMAARSGTITRFRRSACAPSTGFAVVVGDDEGRVVSRDDGDAEPPLVVVTPAQPPSSSASARPAPTPWALLEISVRRIGLLLC